MSLLTDQKWRTLYTADTSNLVEEFYLPALAAATRYDRSTGYFNASALALAARGVEGLVRNHGKMRLVVGCTLGPEEVEAIKKGTELREVLAGRVAQPLVPPDAVARDALELLSWMIAEGFLEVKVAVPCDAERSPVPSDGIFHSKAGIIEDQAGNRLAFNGSVNETESGWTRNWESFHVFTTWSGTSDHVDDEERTFQELWADHSNHVVVVDVPAAVRDELLRFLPGKDGPARLKAPPKKAAPQKAAVTNEDPGELRKKVWSFIRLAATLPVGGDRVGEATSAVTPWPHQVRAFQRMYSHWPPRLLIADEVGLGKTIEAGLVLRQAWLSGRAKRILILAPKAVMRQWQIELREKFNLNWPIYDGQALNWLPTRALSGSVSKPASRDTWHKEPFVIASSHLLRRKERHADLLEKADPYDLVILDEAHHARRHAAGSTGEKGPNSLLRLMRGLQERTQGLLLLTATPMQVHPVELWDLLNLLGLPGAWSAKAFLGYFEMAAKANPSHEELDQLALLFQESEKLFGKVTEVEVQRLREGTSPITAKKVLKALRDRASTPRKLLESPERTLAVDVLRRTTPARHLVSRYTRSLLHRYQAENKLKERIADRRVQDLLIDMTDPERKIYTAVEDYISKTWNRAAQAERSSVGFVMTIYRRRLASSFRALAKTLQGRLDALKDPRLAFPLDAVAAEDDLSDDELVAEVMDTEEAGELARTALKDEEKTSIGDLLSQVKHLPVDSKAHALMKVLAGFEGTEYGQVMVFTQFTDTMDFLREELARSGRTRLMCFSGRGGEILTTSGTWEHVSREVVKQRFRAGDADVLLCTDAASEGLNFQFCGVLVNYDLPWNPMRVEQRIGRLDRLGQAHDTIQIINLHYRDTVEADVYNALSKRIQQFRLFVGRLQPILARLPKRIADASLGPQGIRDKARHDIVSEIHEAANATSSSGFDLDESTGADLEMPPRPPSPVTLQDLSALLRHPELLPPGVATKDLGLDVSWQAPGMAEPQRVTTDPHFFDEHSESVELWSPGSPLFPMPQDDGAPAVEGVKRLGELLGGVHAT